MARSSNAGFTRGGRLGSYLHDLRLAHTVPVLQRRFDISLQKIDGTEKIIAVGIAGIEMKRPAQVTSRHAIPFLFERDSRQFQRKAFVAGLELRAGFECSTGVVPTS